MSTLDKMDFGTDMLEFYAAVLIVWGPDARGEYPRENPRFETVLVAEHMFERFDETVAEMETHEIVWIAYLTRVPVVCKVCGDTMEFDPGQPQTWDEPGEPAAMICSNPDCDGYDLNIPQEIACWYWGQPK